ncbi:hypothetical protein [Algivirga pacifica]|uniref:Uncharacterized protein n=1 Tax=Algivirga pacifica TaxID=1162670 RepID=A0ABP9DA81_9BACT
MTKTHKRISKNIISIEGIGEKRFWIGIAAGVITAFSISFTINYFRELFRIFTVLSADLLILEKEELLFFNLFFALCAAVLGLSITLWVWMSNHQHTHRMDNLYKQLSRTNILLIFWSILMVITRFGSMILLVLFGHAGYDNQLNLYEEFWLLFLLIPLVIFAQSWFVIRLIYRTGKWIILSFIACLAVTFTLYLTTTIDQDKFNTIYELKFEQEFQYIEEEITKADIHYGIKFSPKTITTLKKWHTEKAMQQMDDIKSAFSQEQSISLDTIILQKILIRNFKENHKHYHRYYARESWYYAYPKDLLRQIYLAQNDQNKMNELCQVLKEQIDLINTDAINWEEYDQYNTTERRRSYSYRFIPDAIIWELEEVRDSLRLIEEYYDILPNIKKERIPTE